MYKAYTPLLRELVRAALTSARARYVGRAGGRARARHVGRAADLRMGNRARAGCGGRAADLRAGNRARTRRGLRLRAGSGCRALRASIRAAYRAGAVSFVRLPVTVVVPGVVVRFGSVEMVRPFVRFMLGAMPRIVAMVILRRLGGVVAAARVVVVVDTPGSRAPIRYIATSIQQVDGENR